jgi:hypothetical protein
MEDKDYCCKYLAHHFHIGAPACYNLVISKGHRDKSEINVRNEKQVPTMDQISMNKKSEQMVKECKIFFELYNYGTNLAHRHKYKIELIDSPQWKRY